MMGGAARSRRLGRRSDEASRGAQIRGLEALRERGMNLAQPAARLAVAASRRVEASQAERGPQLQRAGALTARDLQRASEAFERLAPAVLLRSRARGLAEELALQPVQLRLVGTLSGVLAHPQRLLDAGEAFLGSVRQAATFR